MNKETLSQLEKSRKDLLDLGLKNPLINHRKKAKQVRIVDENASDVYRILVTEQRIMGFEALPPASRHTDKKLQTDLNIDKLHTRLLSIHNDAKTYIEEQGVNILYLAIGFLYWYDTEFAQEPRRAPLILVPVSLSRKNAQERFYISYTGDEIGANLSLEKKLNDEFYIKIPKIETGEEFDVDQYIELIRTAIKTKDNWRVEGNEMTLGFFSFGKFLMYKDLDTAGWAEGIAGQGIAILDALLLDGFSEPESYYSDATHIDKIVKPRDIQLISDADSTQMLAILDVKSARNLVIQGPPGTGKSQTITNIIADSIGNGKKVLFVSEKMAALDVVKRRLDEVELGDAVLELHSYKTNKKEIISELDRTLKQRSPITGKLEEDFNRLKLLQDALNDYCEAVNTSIGNTKLNFVYTLGELLKFGNLKIEPFPFYFMQTWSESDYQAARLEVERMDSLLNRFGFIDRNPFRLSELTEYLPSKKPELERVIKLAKDAAEKLETLAKEMESILELNRFHSVTKFQEDLLLAEKILYAHSVPGINYESNDWLERFNDLEVLIKTGKNLQEEYLDYRDLLYDEILEHDLAFIHLQYKTHGDKWWRFLVGDFRKAKKKISLITKINPRFKTLDEIILCLKKINSAKQKKIILNSLEGLGQGLFGDYWLQELSDWDKLQFIAFWMKDLKGDINAGLLPKSVLDLMNNHSKLDALKKIIDLARNSFSEYQAAIINFSTVLKISIDYSGKRGLPDNLSDQVNFIEDMFNNMDDIENGVRYNELCNSLKSNGLSFIANAVEEKDFSEIGLLKTFDYSWYNGLVEKAFSESSAIRTFNSEYHLNIISEFNRLDQRIISENKSRLIEKHWKSLPRLSDGGEVQIISREINKKRKHLPIRKLLQEAGRAVQAIKPVFMMSPMSIAAYTIPGKIQFDLVIFDEASQIKPVDALGAIIRGKQVVVVGDSKQLPPTNFFDKLNEAEDEIDSESVSDMESILSLFLGKGAPDRMLRWHYRSKHESLIAVSNHEFYENQLIVFPSPEKKTGKQGLKLNHLPDTAYDRGKTRSNQKEAYTVALAVMDHAKKHGSMSLGVVAFSSAQRDAIEQHIEYLRKNDSSCESFFDEKKEEPFFVKNLENVQGDEREVIFISIGYGKSEDGIMAMNFGPLNREGGERRLNVLITRARRSMEVFSNFTDLDINLSKTDARGVIALKNFLAYARTGIIEQPYRTGKEPDSPFEEQVISALVKHGIEIEPQVGTAGYSIDIAVKDNQHPGRYILGIECDGATYHRSRSARDRDRLRQAVLEGLGWKIHRIWSTEWFRNPKMELDKALAAIEKAYADKNNENKKNIEDPPAQAEGKIKRKNIEINQDNISIPYIRSKFKLKTKSHDLNIVPLNELLDAIKKVVEIESPIHEKEVINRITECAGLRRSGERIQYTVKNAVNHAVKENIIKKKGDFLWDIGMINVIVRNRSALEAKDKKIEYISSEEIQQALFMVIRKAFSMEEEEAISQAAKIIGFQRVTEQIKFVFYNILKKLMKYKYVKKVNGVFSILYEADV